MQRPGTHEFILGNRAVTISLLCASFWGLYASATMHVTWLFPITCLVLGHRAAKAREKVVEYRQWRRTWNNMAGITPQLEARKRQRRRVLRWALGVSALLLMALWLAGHPRESGTVAYKCVEVACVLLCAWGWRGPMRRLAGVLRLGAAASGGARSGGTQIVSCCLPVPWSSPGPRQIAAALPSYCRALVARPADHEGTEPELSAP